MVGFVQKTLTWPPGFPVAAAGFGAVITVVPPLVLGDTALAAADVALPAGDAAGTAADDELAVGATDAAGDAAALATDEAAPAGFVAAAVVAVGAVLLPPHAARRALAAAALLATRNRRRVRVCRVTSSITKPPPFPTESGHNSMPLNPSCSRLSTSCGSVPPFPHPAQPPAPAARSGGRCPR